MELSPISSRRSLNASGAKLVARCKRKQSDVARLLDRERKAALMARANASQAARNDLAALSHEALKQANVAVGDRVNLLSAELADLLAAEELASSGSASAGSSGRARCARAARACGAG